MGATILYQVVESELRVFIVTVVCMVICPWKVTVKSDHKYNKLTVKCRATDTLI